MNSEDEFVVVGKREFREHFQPSRILIGILPAPTRSGFNSITLAYDMWCSKKPVMMATAIQNTNASYELAQAADEYVLAVPGAGMADDALYCGVKSMRETDKIADLGLHLARSKTISVPGLSAAIANIELVKEAVVYCGDHLLLIGRVLGYNLNKSNDDLPLLSISPRARGYKVLVRHGIHTIAVASTSTSPRDL